MAWEKALDMKAFNDNPMQRVVINQTPILLIKDQDKVYALDDRCPHLKASLVKGSYEKGIVTCPKHNAQIDIKTGDILEKAKILFLKMPTKKAKIFKTKVDKESIFVEQ